MAHPLYVAILWHMHQPCYQDPVTGIYALPWVRLHGAKDYLRMANVLTEHPRMHASFNVVPSLAEQVEAYASGRAEDRLMLMARKAHWESEDKEYILDLCFSANPRRTIRPYRRYAELYDRRRAAPPRPDAFSQQDCRDALAWFNLVWIDPAWRKEDTRLQVLMQKEQGFTPDDIETIHHVQREILARVLPRYQELRDAGQIELTVSPYYHPILPLVIDNLITWQPQTDQVRPAFPLRAPEDAEAQLRLARRYYRQTFGSAARGLWPSEGAVSTEVLILAWQIGFGWVASDEAILGRSLGRPFERDSRGLVTRPRELYRPYRLLVEG